MKIYAGNLANDVTEEDLEKSFKLFGKVTSVIIVKDAESGESKGFAYVEMKSKSDSNAAITGLNGYELKGNALAVNKARAGKGGSGTGGSSGIKPKIGGFTSAVGGGIKGNKGGFGGAGGGRPNRSGQRGS